MADVLTDFKFALRQLRRAPGFAAACLACLALGIGATAAIFSVVNAVVLRPLPYAESGRLLRLYSEWPTWTGGGMWKFWISPPEFRDLRRDNQVFETLDAWQPGGANLSPSGRDPVRVNTAAVSGNLLGALGVQPIRGRVLQPSDDREGAPLAIVLSYGLWQGAFGGEDAAIGREVLLNGSKATVAGVMPRGFEFPPGDTEPAEIWTPLQLTGRDMERWGNHRLSLLGRLKPGMTLAQANLELDRLERTYGQLAGPGTHRFNPKTHTLAAFSLLEETVGNVRPAMMLMFWSTALILLIACGNVANLLLARAQTRQREVAVRQAMGASNAGLTRQFFLEGILLTLAGALLGLGFAFAMLKVILAVGSASIPRATEVKLDGAVLLFCLVTALVTGTVFALAPLVQTSRARLFETLKSAGNRTTATRQAHWLRQSLVVGETALALMLLSGAGLLLNTFWRLTRIQAGIRPEGIMSMRITLPQQNYPQAGDIQRFWREATESIGRLPGVTGVSVLAALPPQRPINANDTYIEGLVPKPGGPLHNVDYWNGASSGAFEMLGVQLVEGRTFGPGDGESAPRVLVVNETFAKTFYGGASALGRRVKPGGQPNDSTPWFTIIGVIKDIKNQGLDRKAGTELFFALPQTGTARAGTLLVKTAGDPWRVLAPVRERLRGIDAALPLAQVRPLEEAISRARARPRFLALLLSLFALVALGLAAMGIFSVMMYTVAQRTNEFGIRMALGAQSSDVLGRVLRQGMVLVAAGIGLGAAAAWALSRTLQGMISGLADLHWGPPAATAALLALVTLAACWAPARRATRVDPVKALRYE
jgi:predicted permease